MKHEIRSTAQWGKVLWLSNDDIELGIALDFGIRIVHLSCKGMENLFYVQPNDLSDTFITEEGWRLYGGHRMWLAPETDSSYYPDNDPVTYTLEENSVLIEQLPDPWMQPRKRLKVTFTPEGTVQLDHSFENLQDTPVTGASWGVNTLDGGGTANICFARTVRGGYNPKRTVAVWSDTDLHDSRLHFTKDSLTAKHEPMPGYLKIGLYSDPCKAVLTNKGQRLCIQANVFPMASCPDNGCNFELYLCSNFMELEFLGPQTDILPGCSACHTEVWQLSKL